MSTAYTAESTYTPYTTRPALRALAFSFALLASTLTVGGNLSLADHYASATPAGTGTALLAKRTGAGQCARA